MHSDLGKLFVGGISWDTNEERLKEYFNAYGEVVEAIIMKDRTTGRARGFGFVVFADPAVAERVIKEKHSIDGRMVEAKKAVPRDDQNVLSRNSGSIHGSPGQGRTRKIFVGGLASTVTESDFRKYFEQFGSITDVVVMYDHNTQRPRGFGFITYDSEEAVDKVLVKTFHELNGKMVEVKRAVPKELSPGPTRSPVGGYHYGPSRVSGFLNGYTPNGLGGFGVRMDGRFSPIVGSRSGFPPFGSGYGMGLNFDSVLSPGFGGGGSFNSNPNYGREPSPYYIGNSNRFDGSIAFDDGNGGSSSLFSSATRNLWGNGGLRYVANSASSNAFPGSGSGGNSGLNWDPSPISPAQGAGNFSVQSGNLSYGRGENPYGLELGGDGRNTGNGSSANGGYDGAFGGLYRNASSYGDTATWRSGSAERDGPVPFGFGLGDAASDIPANNSPGYVGGFTVSKRPLARENLSFN